MDYLCAKFGNFSFSRFGFIVRTESQNYRHKELYTGAEAHLTRLPTLTHFIRLLHFVLIPAYLFISIVNNFSRRNSAKSRFVIRIYMLRYRTSSFQARIRIHVARGYNTFTLLRRARHIYATLPTRRSYGMIGIDSRDFF